MLHAMPRDYTAEQLLRRKVGQQVKALREKRRLTQGELGRRAGVAQGTISRIEAGDYPALTVSAIIDVAYALECAPGDLLDWPVGIMHIAATDPGRPALEAVSA